MNLVSDLVSFVIPVRNEEHTVQELYRRIAHEARRLGLCWEILFLDDGSSDSTWQNICLPLAPVNNIWLPRSLVVPTCWPPVVQPVRSVHGILSWP